MDDLSVALIGCGGIGSVHLERWLNSPGVHVAAVCDVNAVAAARAAGRSGARPFSDIADALAVPGLVAADICTPPVFHEEPALAALAKGLHVLCEKPLAPTPDAAATIVAAAQRADRLLMTAFCHRFHPPIVVARRLIAEGRLGRLAMVRNRFSGLFSGVEKLWFSNRAISGGGTLLDTAIHSIDLFRFLAGDVKAVSGRIGTFLPGLTVEDSAVLCLESVAGTLGVIEASWATPCGRNVVEIYGTEGACFVDYDDGSLRYRASGSSEWETPGAEGPDRFQAEIDHFAAAVRGECSLAVTGVDGLRAVEVAAQVSSQ